MCDAIIYVNGIVSSKAKVNPLKANANPLTFQTISENRGAGSNLGHSGGGGGRGASRKRTPYFTLANKQKSLTLKNSLSLLNRYD